MNNNDDIDIMEFRRKLFVRFQAQLDGMATRRDEVYGKGPAAFNSKAGQGAPSYVARMEQIRKQDDDICKALIAAIEKTKKEADLEEQLKQAKAKNKELEILLEQLEQQVVEGE